MHTIFWLEKLKKFLAQKSITEMEHSHCSPYLVSNVFCVSESNKVCLKGTKISGY
jgi:hypothetical protein